MNFPCDQVSEFLADTLIQAGYVAGRRTEPARMIGRQNAFGEKQLEFQRSWAVSTWSEH